MITIGEIDPRVLAIGVAKIGVATGFFGAMTWQLFWSICCAVSNFINDKSERRMRVAVARSRSVHGPLLLPGTGALERRFLRRVVRVLFRDGAGVVRARERHAGAGADCAHNVQ